MHAVGQVAGADPAGRAVEVGARATPASPRAIRDSLSRAYRAFTGAAPSAATLDVLAAHVGHETGRGASMYNFNFGGIKGAGPGGRTARCRTTEVLDGREVGMRLPFRAYTSMDAGAADYLSVLRSRYPRAFAAAQQGDVDAFVGALRAGHYFTGSPEDYAASMRALCREGVSGPVAAPVTPAPAPDARAAELPTSAEVARVLDALSSLTASIARPVEDPESW